MKKRVAILLLVIGSILGWSMAHAAQFTGKVTTNDGITPVANLNVYLYKYNVVKGSYEYEQSTNTDNLGSFTLTPNGLTATHIGVYLVSFIADTPYRGDPFYYSYYYQANPLSLYYNETYDNVTPLTPNKAPEQLIITNAGQTIDLGLVRLNRKTVGCIVFDEITINGVPYAYFSAYGSGPKLPATGGSLNISFTLRNLGTKEVTTEVQPLVFLRRRDAPVLMDARSVKSFASKTYTVPPKSTKIVSLSVAIPGTFMTATPPLIYYPWAFNIGIQMVNSNVLPNSASSMIMFPVLHETTSSGTVFDEPSLDGTLKQLPEIVPLRLSKDGKILEWGPIPDANAQ
jgi:hypothetical protein